MKSLGGTGFPACAGTAEGGGATQELLVTGELMVGCAHPTSFSLELETFRNRLYISRLFAIPIKMQGAET